MFFSSVCSQWFYSCISEDVSLEETNTVMFVYLPVSVMLQGEQGPAGLNGEKGPTVNISVYPSLHQTLNEFRHTGLVGKRH